MQAGLRWGSPPSLAVSRAFAMPAGRALKPPGPASVEINTGINSELCVAPLAPFAPRPARSIQDPSGFSALSARPLRRAGCTDPSGTIRRRQRAVQTGPHMSRGPAGQSPTRLGHHASQEVLKPGLCYSANRCPGTWRRRRVRACTDPHTGSASPQICMGPLALPMRRSQWPSHIGPHARLVLVCASVRFSACTA